MVTVTLTIAQLDALKVEAMMQRRLWGARNARTPGDRDIMVQMEFWAAISAALESAKAVP